VFLTSIPSYSNEWWLTDWDVRYRL
jgi:hypothetical protein